jgi:pimeloyl-ACP methyl ester carboxylesterase
MRTTRRRAVAACLAMAALATTGVVGGPMSAGAQTNPYQRGPNPTESSVTATRGPYSVATTSVSSTAAGSGFGGGTIYYPTTTSDGTFGAVTISPGFTARQSSMSWYGPRLASNGFVVFTIDTNSTSDQPDSRARQLLASLDYLTARSSVANRIDRNRLAVMGHSMGGGGSLAASVSRQTLKASVPLTPWHGTKTFRTSVPQMIIGAQNDSTASVRSHAIPHYEGVPSTTAKAYLELAGASHFAPNSSNTTIGKYSLSWLKRFVDEDTRYAQFLCGPNHTADRAISQYRSTCPYPGGGGGSGPAPTTTTTAASCRWWWCR